MLDVIVNSFGIAFVLVTGLVVVVFAVGGILVAVWSAREYLKTRGAEPVDWYDVTLPPAPRRAAALQRNSSPRGQPGAVAVLDGGVPVEETYQQEELPF